MSCVLLEKSNMLPSSSFTLFLLNSDVATLNNNNAHTINQNQVNSSPSSMLIKDNNIDDGSIDPMEHGQDQPDADYIKMFVGQVPRSMNEAQLRKSQSYFMREIIH